MKDTHNYRVVLVGAGHAHLCIAAQAGRFAAQGIELTLVDPGEFWQPGIATGMLSGAYDRAAAVIQPRAVIESRGGIFIQDRVTAIDAALQQLHLVGGRALAYDAASFNIGSEVDLSQPPGAAQHALPVKPFSNLWRVRQRLEDHFRVNPGKPVRLVVIGGGVSGCEIAANLDQLGRSHLAAADITIIEGNPRLVSRHTRFVSAKLLEWLKSRGLRILLDAAAVRVTGEYVQTTDRRQIPCDLALVATGLRPPRAIAKLGLAIGKEGGLPVNAALQVRGQTRVFAAGDCIEFHDHPLPKLASHALRQAAVLTHNLLAAVHGKDMAHYHPHRPALELIDLSDHMGMAIWGPFCWRGRLPMHAKHREEKRFIRRLRPNPQA